MAAPPRVVPYSAATEDRRMRALSTSTARCATGRLNRPLAVLLAVCAAPAAALAGNTEPFLFCDEAAMSGGAVTAVTHEPGSAWYNPAGLSSIRRNKVSVSGNAFVLRVRELVGVLRTELPSSSDVADPSTSSVDPASVPAGLVFAHHFRGSLTGAIGLFVTQNDFVSYRADLREQGTLWGDETLSDVTQHVEIMRREAKYNLGPSFGWEITPRLRFGVSVYGTYFTRRRSESVYAGTRPHVEPREPIDPDEAVIHRDVNDQLYQVGAFMAVALQWDLTPKLRLGIVLRMPEALLYRWGASSVTRVNAPGGNWCPTPDGEDTTGGPSTGVCTTTPNDDPFHVITPMQVRVGLAYEFRRGWVSVEADLRLALDDFLSEDTEPLWNVRAGVSVDVTPRLTVGAGVFTDRSTLGEPDGLAAPAVDYYGLSLGLQFLSPHALRNNPAPDALVFATTFAVRYAVGIGQAAAVLLRPGETGPGSVSFPSLDVTFHEASLYVGTALYF